MYVNILTLNFHRKLTFAYFRFCLIFANSFFESLWDIQRPNRGIISEMHVNPYFYIFSFSRTYIMYINTFIGDVHSIVYYNESSSFKY